MNLDALPFGVTEAALKEIMSICSGAQRDGVDDRKSSLYQRCHATIFPRLLVGSFTDPVFEKTEKLPVGDELSPSELDNLWYLRVSVEKTLKKLYAVLPINAAKQSRTIDAAKVAAFVNTGRSIFAETVTYPKPRNDQYARLRTEWLSECARSAPIALLTCENATAVRKEYERLERSDYQAESVIFYDLNFLTALLGEEVIEPAPVPSSQWTGRRTVAERAIAIRQFAPIALQALDDLISLYEIVSSNRAPTQAEKDTIALLRRLHSDLGALLAAVEAGRPFGALVTRVARAAGRVFSLGAETKELLIAGTPALAAAGITSLAVLKGLEFCGVGVSTAEAAATLGLTGTVFAAHSVVERARKPQ